MGWGEPFVTKDSVTRPRGERVSKPISLTPELGKVWAPPKATPPKSAGDPRFHAILKEMADLHDRKQEDYGTDADPLANIRASQEWGVPAYVGALVRLNDKVHRLKAFARKGSLANESAEDSMIDIAVYAILALVLYREESES